MQSQQNVYEKLDDLEKSVKKLLDYDEKTETIDPTCLLKLTSNLNHDLYHGYYKKMELDMHIALFLQNNDFIDTMNGNHYHATATDHAQRIASLVNLINTGTILVPVVLYITNTCENIEIDDGHHRFYAYLYTKTRMRVILDIDMD
jgi:hypothetical protein